jgi:hypothetical protein
MGKGPTLLTVALAALSALYLGGCRPRPSRVDEFGEAVAAADTLWAARSGSGLEAAERAYTALLAERPNASAVLWRLSRVAWSRAMIEPARAATWHEVGREYALRCVAGDPSVAAALLDVGDRLTPPVTVAEAPPGCRVFGAAHVVALVAARGPGAALDLEDAAPLLDGVTVDADPAAAAWAAGKLRVLRGVESGEAREALVRAVTAAPGVRFYREEALAAFPDLDGGLPAFTPDPAWTLENEGPGR